MLVLKARVSADDCQKSCEPTNRYKPKPSSFPVLFIKHTAKSFSSFTAEHSGPVKTMHPAACVKHSR